MNRVFSLCRRPRPRFFHFCLLALLALPLLAVGCSRDGGGPITTLPQFSLASAADGSPINSRDFKGQALIVNFFATWCQPCRQEVPSLIALQNKYGERNFSVLGIAVEQNDRAIRNFMSELGINYPVAMSAPDTPKTFGGVFGIPATFLIDRQGNMIRRFDGHVDIQVLEHELQAIL